MHEHVLNARTLEGANPEAVPIGRIDYEVTIDENRAVEIRIVTTAIKTELI